jgi:hypothetical protein
LKCDHGAAGGGLFGMHVIGFRQIGIHDQHVTGRTEKRLEI